MGCNTSTSKGGVVLPLRRTENPGCSSEDSSFLRNAACSPEALTSERALQVREVEEATPSKVFLADSDLGTPIVTLKCKVRRRFPLRLKRKNACSSEDSNSLHAAACSRDASISAVVQGLEVAGSTPSKASLVEDDLDTPLVTLKGKAQRRLPASSKRAEHVMKSPVTESPLPGVVESVDAFKPWQETTENDTLALNTPMKMVCDVPVRTHTPTFGNNLVTATMCDVKQGHTLEHVVLCPEAATEDVQLHPPEAAPFRFKVASSSLLEPSREIDSLMQPSFRLPASPLRNRSGKITLPPLKREGVGEWPRK
jgi:hypothetical protein